MPDVQEFSDVYFIYQFQKSQSDYSFSVMFHRYKGLMYDKALILYHDNRLKVQDKQPEDYFSDLADVLKKALLYPSKVYLDKDNFKFSVILISHINGYHNNLIRLSFVQKKDIERNKISLDEYMKDTSVVGRFRGNLLNNSWITDRDYNFYCQYTSVLEKAMMEDEACNAFYNSLTPKESILVDCLMHGMLMTEILAKNLIAGINCVNGLYLIKHKIENKFRQIQFRYC
jgi:hypothetical protein